MVCQNGRPLHIPQRTKVEKITQVGSIPARISSMHPCCASNASCWVCFMWPGPVSSFQLLLIQWSPWRTPGNGWMTGYPFLKRCSHFVHILFTRDPKCMELGSWDIPTLSHWLPRWLRGTHQSHGWSICRNTNCRMRHDSNDSKNSNDSMPDRKCWPSAFTAIATTLQLDECTNAAYQAADKIEMTMAVSRLLPDHGSWRKTSDDSQPSLRASDEVDNGWKKENRQFWILGKVWKIRTAGGLAPEIATNACKTIAISKAPLPFQLI